MDLPFPSIPLLFSFIVFMFLVRKIGKKIKSSSPSLNLPPGPWKLPLIGNMHQLAGAEPHHRLRDLAKRHGPIMHLQLGEVSNIVFSSAETAKELLKTHDILFAQRPAIYSASILTYNCTDIAFAPYGEYWRQLRKICILELLSSKRVRSYRSIREEEVMELLKTIKSSAGTLIDLSNKLYTWTYSVTSRAAFGKVWSGKDEFLPVVRDVSRAGSGFNLADIFPSIKILPIISGLRHEILRHHEKVDGMLENIINEHRARRGEPRNDIDDGEEDDLVDVLLNVQEHGDLKFPLTEDNIKAVIMDLFIAGIDTSSTIVDWAIVELLKNPNVMKKAQKEVRECFRSSDRIDEENIHKLHYLKLVIKETFRLHPPVPLLLPRECREACNINKYDIPIKSKVLVNVWAIGRDSKYWPDPERFYPERFLESSIDYKGNDFEFIPFGSGRKMCPGVLFGVANVELLLAQLLYHFDWKLPDWMTPENMDMTEDFGSVVRRKSHLRSVPIPHSPVDKDFRCKMCKGQNS